MDKAFSKTPEQLSKELQTDLKSGLTSNEAALRLQKYGPNQLKAKAGKNPLLIFISQFKSFLILILILAGIGAFFLGESIDAMVILAIILMNGVVGFIQEYRVEKAIEHLKKLVTTYSKVYRDGKIIEIESKYLVPGDLISLEEGQKVPADIRIIQSINLQTIEAPLTGESTPILKTEKALEGELVVADQKNMLFSGTVITSGKGLGLVISTGMKTEIGKIAHLVQTTIDTDTPMQKKLDKLGTTIGKIVLLIAVIVGLEEVFFGSQDLLQAVLSSVALAVAAIPEGLPAVVTIALALGTKRLLIQKALIRNLPAAETLGSTDIICCDKTGTLTEGVMTVRKTYGSNNLYQMAVLASNARVDNGKIIGDTTEGAIIQKALELGINQNDLNIKYPRVQEIPFSSDRKMMTVVVKDGNNFLVASKGATEVILDRCTKLEKDGKVINLTNVQKQEILKQNDQMAKQALRVLAVAYKPIKKVSQNIENDLIFAGLVGLMDPPRKGVKEAINECYSAGIKVVMITGDHLITAQAVSAEIGINGEAITGVELQKLSDEEFRARIEQIAIYARVNPEDKIRIVQALKAHGHQVAMTGDGVNDAPALKAADMGVAMGITGTDVAKDSSDMILMDDRFTTIVAAIKEGRSIYENIKKFVNYLLSSNMMEVLIIFIAILLGWPLPLLPIHLLWINLVTDGLPAIALGVDPARGNIMTSKPLQFREEIVTAKFLRSMFIISIMLTGAILGIFGFSKSDLIHAQTLTFTAVVLYELIRIVAIRSQYNLALFSNKLLVLAISISLVLQLLVLYLPLNIAGNSLQTLFKVQSLNLSDWGILLGIGAALLIIMRFYSALTVKLKFG